MVPDEPNGQSVFHLLAGAVAVWIGSALLFIAWFFASTPEPGLAAFGIPLVAWALGYVPGGIGLLAVAAAQVARTRVPMPAALWALVVYCLPAILIGFVLRMPVLLAPLAAAEGDLEGLVAAATGPVLAVLYLVGLGHGYAVRHRPLRRTVTAIVLPPIAGLVIAAGWSAATVMRSPEARARGSVGFVIERVEVAPDRVTADGMLTLERPGAYRFHAIYLEFGGGSSGGRANAIEWPDGVPSQPGRYRCRLVFGGVTTHTEADSRLIVFEVRANTGRVYDPPVAEFRMPVDGLIVRRAASARR